MPDPHDPDPDVTPLNSGDPLARQLATLAPAVPRLDRDAILFAAGTAARGRAVTGWRVAALVQTGLLAAAAVYISLPGEPVPQPVSPPPAPVVVAPKPPAPEPAGPSGPPQTFVIAPEGDDGDAYRGLRRRADVIAAGVSALPTPTAPPPVADPAELERGLHLPPGVLAVPTPPKKTPPPEDSP